MKVLKRFLCAMFAAVMLSGPIGCAPKADSGTDESVVNSEESRTGIPVELPEDLPEINLSGLIGNDFRDNTLDPYMAVANQRLEISKPEGVIGGAGNFVITGNGAWGFQKYILQSIEECWDEISCVTAGGDQKSARLDYERGEGSLGQAWAVGRVADSNCSLVLYSVNSGNGDGTYHNRYTIRKVDENLEATGMSWEIGFMEGETMYYVADFLQDPQGRFHMILEGKYVTVSPEGELLSEFAFDEENSMPERLAVLADGRVGVKVSRSEVKDDGVVERWWNEIWLPDPEKGEMEKWTSVEKKYDINQLLRYDFERYDEEHIVSVDATGLYLCDRTGENPEYLYQWRRHGISISGISVIQVQEDRTITLLCEDPEGYFFLKLAPVTEKQEIRRITLAASPHQKDIYSAYVTEFNKRYPAYHVELKTDYDSTALLTALIAGEGPVLIDTSLAGFEDHADLWLPLDGIFEQLGLTEELFPKAMELGQIDGKLYGISSDFVLQTVVTADKSLKDWDYEAFLQRIRQGGMKAVYNTYSDGDLGLFLQFLSSSLEDNYLIDAAKQETVFQTESFREILELAEKYCPYGKEVPGDEGLLEGEVLCNTVYIRRPEDIAYYRVRYGDSLQFIGFPGGEGSRHYLLGSRSLAVRRTANTEDLELALLFLKHLLSKECQRSAARETAFALSVRKDILQEQIDAMNEETLIRGSGMWKGLPLGDKLDNKQDGEMLYRLLEQAEPWEGFPQELQTILAQELGAYFSGTAGKEEMSKRLDNRVLLYLKEQE